MTNKIIGIIPAAGKGTRLGLPYPKELAHVSYNGNRIITVIESNIKQLANAGVDEAIIVISPEKQVIKEHLGDFQSGVHLRYVNQSRKRSREGLTDAVMSAKPLIENSSLMVMLMGDVFFTYKDTVKKLVENIQHDSTALVALSIWPTYEPHRFGIVKIDGDRVLSVVDKPEGLTHGYHWGAVAFRSDFWFYMDYELETFSHALSKASGSERIIYEYTGGNYLDLGTPKSLIEGIKEINE